MSLAILLLVLSLFSVQAQDVTEHTSSDRQGALDLIAPDRDVGRLRNKYLADASVSTEIKQAIAGRLVIPGMCPLEAFAAAGLPLTYMVHTLDHKRPFNPAIITAQCERPEDNVAVELLFRTGTQFNTPKPVIFRVRFESGRAVFVDRERRLGRPRQTDE